MVLGVLASVLGSINTLNSIETRRYLYIGIAGALGAGVLVSLTTYVIRRIASHRMDTDRIRNAIEGAYFRALERSVLNPKSAKTLVYAERPN